MVEVVAMRNTLPCNSQSRLLFLSTIWSAWSHGTSSSTMVNEPFTAGSSTTFNPLMSWISRKKSRRSMSFKFTEIGSPLYLLLPQLPDWVAGLAGAACCGIMATFNAGCVLRLAFTGFTGSSLLLRVAVTTTAWSADRVAAISSWVAGRVVTVGSTTTAACATTGAAGLFTVLLDFCSTAARDGN